jgi:hypothetical protein
MCPQQILMEWTHVGALTGFTYPETLMGFSQLACCDEKYSQLKLMNIKNNSENFMVNFWYLNISLSCRSNIYTRILNINPHELKFQWLLEYWSNSHEFNKLIIKNKMHTKK